VLVAHLENRRVEAVGAQRGADFVCSGCGAPVILRRGRKVVAHFAHRPSAAGTARTAETRGHLQAKRLLHDALRARGLRAEAEFATEQVAWDRRADVMVWSPGSRLPVAIEFQHSTIGIPELEVRAQTYARAGIAQLWVPFLRPDAFTRAELAVHGTRIVERYPVRLHELWMYGMAPERAFWMFDPDTQTFWNARFGDHRLMNREAIWYEMGAVKRYTRGGERRSRRYRSLRLAGPWSATELRLRTVARPAHRTEWFEWPECRVATFVGSRDEVCRSAVR